MDKRSSRRSSNQGSLNDRVSKLSRPSAEGGPSFSRRMSSRLSHPSLQNMRSSNGSQFSLMETSEKKRFFRAIHPQDRRYMVFWYFCMGVALWSAVLEPYNIGFGVQSGFYPYHDFWSINLFVTTFIFFVDIALKFFLAFTDSKEVLVTKLSRIAVHYTMKLFWFDLLFAFPLDGVIIQILGGHENMSPQTAMCISLLRFLKLGRLYRIFDFFGIMDHSMILSQMALILLRNNTYVFFTAHWFACLIYFIGRIEYMNEVPSWIGRSIGRLEGQPQLIRYVYSLYYSVNMLTGVGDGDFYSASPLESIAMILYLIFNVVLGAYILGTITMLVVKGDERSKDFRDRVTNLREFARINEMPEELMTAMKDHLELFFQSEQTSDAKVLDIYPLAIKRKVLRHLYMEPVKLCYLFKNCKTKFLDELLHHSKVEMFMSRVQIMVEGDHVPNLNIIIDGDVEIYSMGQGLTKQPDKKGGAESADDINDEAKGKSFVASRRKCMLMLNSIKGDMGPMPGWTNIRTTSAAFGEVAFFTESPSVESAWTNTVTRVLQIDKKVFERVSSKIPLMGRQVLTNLEAQSADGILLLLWDAVTSSPLVSTELTNLVTDAMMRDEKAPFLLHELAPPMVKELKMLLAPEELPKFELVLGISEAVSNFGSRHLAASTQNLFDAARKGDMKQLKKLMDMEISPNTTDADKRSALIVASSYGALEAVEYLLHCGADPGMEDSYGITAMLEAVERGHGSIVDRLLLSEAILGISAPLESYYFLKAVAELDTEKVLLYLRASINPNTVNGDGRSALHLLASMKEEHEEIVHTLLQFQANTAIVDCFGRTCLFEAVSRGHTRIVEALIDKGAPLGVEAAVEAQAVQETVLTRNLSKLKQYMLCGANPDALDDDQRTALHMACKAGDLAAVKIFVLYGANSNATDAWGNTPLSEAEKVNADDVVEYLKSNPKKDNTLKRLLRKSFSTSSRRCSVMASQERRALRASFELPRQGLEATTKQESAASLGRRMSALLHGDPLVARMETCSLGIDRNTRTSYVMAHGPVKSALHTGVPHAPSMPQYARHVLIGEAPTAPHVNGGGGAALGDHNPSRFGPGTGLDTGDLNPPHFGAGPGASERDHKTSRFSPEDHKTPRFSPGDHKTSRFSPADHTLPHVGSGPGASEGDHKTSRFSLGNHNLPHVGTGAGTGPPPLLREENSLGTLLREVEDFATHPLPSLRRGNAPGAAGASSSPPSSRRMMGSGRRTSIAVAAAAAAAGASSPDSLDEAIQTLGIREAALPGQGGGAPRVEAPFGRATGGGVPQRSDSPLNLLMGEMGVAPTLTAPLRAASARTSGGTISPGSASTSEWPPVKWRDSPLFRTDEEPVEGSVAGDAGGSGSQDVRSASKLDRSIE